MEGAASGKGRRLWLQLATGTTAFSDRLQMEMEEYADEVKTTCGFGACHFYRVANSSNQTHRLGKTNIWPDPIYALSFSTASALTSPASGCARQWAPSTQEHTTVLTFIVLSSSSLITRRSGSIDFRRIGVRPGRNCPLRSCLKHILGCHHDIELACRNRAVEGQGGTAQVALALPSAPFLPLPPACRLWSAVCTDTAVVSPTLDAGK